MANFSVLSDAARFNNKTQERVSGNFKVRVLADAAGTFVFDTMALTRLGLNFQWSVQFIAWVGGALDTGTLTISGTTDDRSKIYKPSQWPKIAYAPALAAINVGGSANIGAITYSGLKLVFSIAGEARFLTC